MNKGKGLFQVNTIGIRLLTGMLAITILTVLLIMLLVGKMSSGTVIQKSEEMAGAKNEAMVNSIIAEYNVFYQMATNMESRVRNRMSETVKDRKKLADIIKEGMGADKDIIGSGIFFEPNAFDGLDQEFAGKTGYDKSGRISEYYIRTASGDLVKDLQDASNLDNEPWYKIPLNDGKIHFSEPYTQSIGGEIKILATVSVPIKKENKYVGVVTADINLEVFQKALEASSNEHTVFQIITNSGVVAGHGGVRENIMKKYTDIGGTQELIDKIANTEDFALHIYSPSMGEDAYIKYTPIDFPNVPEVWSVSSVWSLSHFTKDVRFLMWLMVIIAGVGLLLISGVMIILSHRLISKPMANAEKLVKQLAEFDFVIENNPKIQKLVKRKDEIGNISRSIEEMVGNVRELIQTIVENAQNVAATSEELTATAETNRESVQEIANAIEEIAHSATEQAQNTEKTSENVENIGQMIEKNLEIIHALTDATGEIELRKNEGRKIIEELVFSSERSSEAAFQIFEAVKETNDSAERIETVSEMIQSIADQTNLLALNAAIEAARAGESGKGFAVVAEEIRKLAEQSTGFTGEIKQVITDLKSRTEQAVEAMGEVKVIAQQQHEKSNLTGEKFEMISRSVETIKDMMDALNNTAETMQNSKIKIVEGVQELSGIAQQNAASSEEVASTAQNQLEAIVGIADASNELSQIAADLQAEVQAFRV